MRRAMAAVGFVVVLGVLSQAAPAPPPPQSVAQKLAQRVKFDGIEDPKTPLGEVLDKLSKLYDVSFEVNERAFQIENVQDVLKSEVAANGPIPALKNVRLDTLLRKVLSRVTSESGVTYLVRDDHIQITTAAAQAAEVWGEYGGPHLPLVNATLEKVPLEDALKELADQAQFSVLLDNRGTDRGKTAVTARFRNTPLDTALRLLADMTDLRSVQLDNVLYVTTKENAAALEARLTREMTPTNPLDDQTDNNAFKPRKGSGPGAPIKPKPGGA